MEHRAELRQTSGASHEAGTKLFLDILLDKFEASEKKDMDLLTYETGELFVAVRCLLVIFISLSLCFVALVKGSFRVVFDRLLTNKLTVNSQNMYFRMWHRILHIILCFFR